MKKIPTNLPIYVINMDRDVHRLRAFHQEMVRLGLEFERLPATDFSTLPESYKREVFVSCKAPIIKHPLSTPEIGCFLSHYNTWCKIAEGDAPLAMVCEDDARFITNFKDVLQSVNDKPPSWDILRLYSHKQEIPLYSEPLIYDHQILTVGKITMSTVAYIITRQAAQQLRDCALPVQMPVDGYLKKWWLHSLCGKQVWPSVAFPVSSEANDSTIEDKRMALRKKIYILRVLNNARFQIHAQLERRKHLPMLPTNRQFF